MLYSIRAAPHTIVLWETATGKERGHIKGGTIAFDSAALAFSPSGRMLAVGGADEVIRLWSVGTGKLLRRFAGHQGGITCLAFAGDEKTLVSGSADTSAVVWDLAPLLRQQPAPLLIDLDAKEFASLWRDLAADDAGPAFTAVNRLGSAKQTPEWVRKLIKPAAGVEEKRLSQLIADLDADQFKVREDSLS